MCELLLAEDDAVSRAFLEAAMAHLGHRAAITADGRQALEHARTRRFGVLLLDVDLPGLSGPQILAQLRGDAAAASHASVAIALTADPEPATHARLCAAGFIEVATKPITLAALQALLARHMGGAGPAGGELSGHRGGFVAWDDAGARHALGGDDGIVARMRELMLAELPRQRDVVLAALRAGRDEEARGELHRLQAACGFCGARSLGDSVDALHALAGTAASAASIDAALARFLADVDRLLHAST